MDGRRVVTLGTGLAVALALAVGFDLLIETDQERVEELVDDITGEVSSTRIAHALSWVDPELEPVEVELFGLHELYRDRESLEADARRSLRVMIGDSFTAISRRVVVEGDVATVRVQLWSSRGVVDLEIGLTKRGDRWLVHRLRRR